MPNDEAKKPRYKDKSWKYYLDTDVERTFRRVRKEIKEREAAAAATATAVPKPSSLKRIV